MLTRLATFVVWHARIVLVVSTIAMLGAAAVGFGAFGKLQTGGFEDPAAESRAAAELLAAEGGTTDLVLLARTASGTVDDPEVQAAGTRLTERLRAEPGIGAVDSYWSTPGPATALERRHRGSRPGRSGRGRRRCDRRELRG